MCTVKRIAARAAEGVGAPRGVEPIGSAARVERREREDGARRRGLRGRDHRLGGALGAYRRDALEWLDELVHAGSSESLCRHASRRRRGRKRGRK